MEVGQAFRREPGNVNKLCGDGGVGFSVNCVWNKQDRDLIPSRSEPTTTTSSSSSTSKAQADTMTDVNVGTEGILVAYTSFGQQGDTRDNIVSEIY